MKIKDLLKTLSDTELVTITEEINNGVCNEVIYDQLLHKCNDSILLINEDILCEVSKELSDRLLERDKNIGILI